MAWNLALLIYESKLLFSKDIMQISCTCKYLTKEKRWKSWKHWKQRREWWNLILVTLCASLNLNVICFIFEFALCWSLTQEFAMWFIYHWHLHCVKVYLTPLHITTFSTRCVEAVLLSSSMFACVEMGQRCWSVDFLVSHLTPHSCFWMILIWSKSLTGHVPCILVWVLECIGQSQDSQCGLPSRYGVKKKKKHPPGTFSPVYVFVGYLKSNLQISVKFRKQKAMGQRGID